MPKASCSTQDPSGSAVPHRREPPRRGLPHRTGSPTVIENGARYKIEV